MSAPRYLCSELVRLRINAADSIVNLQEIWREGAVLESEDPVESGVGVEVRCGNDLVLAGRAVQVERHEFGWRVEVEFSPSTPWNKDLFHPLHLLDPSQLGSE